MATAFDEDVIQLLAEIEEVAIETRAGPDAPAHRTTIWVVVDGDATYVRSVRGTRGRWYREAMACPEVVVYAGERRLPAHVEPVSDLTTIARVSDALLRKYVQWPNDSRAMVREEVLPTTLRLQPAEAS
ncbi:MAG: DUF2255 family protein [Roseiflexaceae bacterium]